jgi:hypothetical protein
MELAELEEKARLFYKLAVVKDRKYRFRTYRSTFVGKEMVDSMVVSGLAESRKQAVALGRAIAENFDLFENCENNFLNKTAYFEDEPNKYYRFSFGALLLIRKINERETNEDEKSVPLAFTSFKSITSKSDRPSRGPGLQRQNGTRKIESYKNGVENYVEGGSVFNKNKRLHSKKKINARLPLTPMHAIVEEDKSESSRVSSRVRTTNTADTEVERVEGIQRLTKEQSEPESDAVQCKLSQGRKVELEKTNMTRPRLLTQYQSRFPNKTLRKTDVSHSIVETIGTKDGHATSMNTQEKMVVDVVRRLQKTHSEHWGAKYGSLREKTDTKGSSVYPDYCPDNETRNQGNIENAETKEDDRRVSPIDEFDVEETRVATLPRETVPTKNKGMEWTKRFEAKKLAWNIMPPNPQISDVVIEPAEEIDPEAVIQPLHQEGSEEQEMPPFVTSPQDLPPGLRRRMSDVTECFDNFEFILKKKEGNLLTMGNDDDRSMWTEFIIGDEEGREKYRHNKIKKRRPSYISCIEKPIIDDDENSCNEFTVVNNGTIYDEQTIYDEEMVNPKRQPSVAPVSVSKKVDDDQSYMEYTVFDDTIAVSYVEDDEDYVAQKPPPEEDEKSIFHIFANRASITGDDDMTQITMDHALMHQPAKYHHNFSISPSLSSASRQASKSCCSTSKNRIQEILWNDLYGCDFSVVRSAMKELRTIVASEPESRKQIVRMGGAMAIMGTMEKYFDLEEIQYYCCVIIELLASMEPDASKAFNEMKGIQLIVRSMQDQADSDRVQEAGRAALVTVCRLHHPGVF